MKKTEVSQLKASLDGDLLIIDYDRARKSALDTQVIEISNSESNTVYRTNVRVKSFHYKNKVMLTQKIKSTDETLVVYTDDNNVLYYKHDNPTTHPLTRLITVKSKVVYIRLTPRGIRMIYACIIENRHRLPVKASFMAVGDDFKRMKKYPIFRHFPSKLQIIKSALFTDYIPMSSLMPEEPSINEQIRVSLDIDGQMAHHTLTRGSKHIKSPKWYYAPITQTRVNGYSVSIRRSAHGGLSLVRRKLEPIELTTSFRFFESKLISFLLYHCAHLVRYFSDSVINLYFEKNANQAEEATIDIFRKARDMSKTRNYFILNKTSKDFAALKDEAGVIQNFTLKSYWLMYRANNIIATEVPQHMNILRSGNKYARRAPYTQKFVFLQHGITYLKAQDKTTSFLKNREGEPDYMVVGSKKERDVVADMLRIEEERLLNVGLAIYDKIKYNHITAKSPDIATIMLTWKPSEEHLQDFSKSMYYQTVIGIYNMLSKLMDKDNIRIVAHPKFAKHLAGTDIASAIWKDSVAGALEGTKLLITDYSSVCYNVFYQGGAVIFYQPDLHQYEQDNGKLIPNDDEYVGHRIYEPEDLKKLLGQSILDEEINLADLRTKRFVDNYRSINQYNDGLNQERLYEKLKTLGML